MRAPWFCEAGSANAPPCYACDSRAVGYRQSKPGAKLEEACARHADPSIKTFPACIFCSGPRPTRVIDGDFAHLGCLREQE